MKYLKELDQVGKEANPFFCLMGIEPVSWGEGRATLSMEVKPEMHNGEGWLQGGVYTAMADEAMALSIYTLLKENETIATISCTTTFMRGVKEGTILADAWVVKRGRQVIFAEAEVRSPDSEYTYARLTASFVVRSL